MNSNHYQLFTILIGFRTASPLYISGHQLPSITNQRVHRKASAHSFLQGKVKRNLARKKSAHRFRLANAEHCLERALFKLSHIPIT